MCMCKISFDRKSATPTNARDGLICEKLSNSVQRYLKYEVRPNI